MNSLYILNKKTTPATPAILQELQDKLGISFAINDGVITAVEGCKESEGKEGAKSWLKSLSR